MNLAACFYWIRLRSYWLMTYPKTFFLKESIKSNLLLWFIVLGNFLFDIIGYFAPLKIGIEALHNFIAKRASKAASSTDLLPATHAIPIICFS
jgi:hypothetical protein